MQVGGALRALGADGPPVVDELADQMELHGDAREEPPQRAVQVVGDVGVRAHRRLEPERAGLVVEDLRDELLACWVVGVGGGGGLVDEVEPRLL